MARSDWQKTTLAVLAVVIPVLLFVATTYQDLGRRVSTLEGEFGIVKELIVRQVATQTFTITTTATLTTTYSSVWGAALAAFIGGICAVLLLAAMVRRRTKP